MKKTEGLESVQPPLEPYMETILRNTRKSGVCTIRTVPTYFALPKA